MNVYGGYIELKIIEVLQRMILIEMERIEESGITIHLDIQDNDSRMSETQDKLYEYAIKHDDDRYRGYDK